MRVPEDQEPLRKGWCRTGAGETALFYVPIQLQEPAHFSTQNVLPTEQHYWTKVCTKLLYL